MSKCRVISGPYFPVFGPNLKISEIQTFPKFLEKLRSLPFSSRSKFERLGKAFLLTALPRIPQIYQENIHMEVLF